MTETIDKLRTFLEVYGIDDTQYTDEQLEILVEQARAFVGKEYTEDTLRTDYVHKYEGSVYMTNYYPILTCEEVEITVDDEEVIPRKITEEGIIYFDETMHGVLSCRYTQGISNEDIEDTILPLVMYMIREQTGTNVAGATSIREGDIQISFDNATNISTNAQITHLVQSLRDKYKARVRLL